MGTFDKQASIRAAEAAWASSPELRAEFVGNREAFIAWRCAVDAGRVKVLATSATGNAAPAPAAQPLDDHQVRAQAERDWNASPAIRAEFGNDLARYLAWRSADARGAIRLHGGQDKTGKR